MEPHRPVYHDHDYPQASTNNASARLNPPQSTEHLLRTGLSRGDSNGPALPRQISATSSIVSDLSRSTSTDGIPQSRPPPTWDDTTHLTGTAKEKPLPRIPPAQTRSFNHVLYRDQWLWEVSSAIFSLLCFAAMAAVLASVDGRSISSWDSPVISPNALIAALSTVGKAAMLLPVTECLSQLKWILLKSDVRRLYDLEIYDRASRGPLGALQLLWSLKLRLGLAAWGALLVLIALAVDPFTQLVLTVETRPTPSANDTASLPVSSAYDFPQSPLCEYFWPISQDLQHLCIILHSLAVEPFPSFVMQIPRRSDPTS